MTNSESLLIKSGQGDYPVHFFSSISDLTASARFDVKETFFIIDETVIDMYPELRNYLSEYKIYPTQAVEEEKTLEGVGRFVNWLLENGATRSGRIVAIGGGIIQDIATFTSDIYYRGIKWEYIPTTLLSQSDSCIGAKCGINVLPHKNQLGVINSPKCVYVVEEFLHSLPKYDFESGFGEILKLSLTGPNEFYQEFLNHLNLYGLNPSKVMPLLQNSLNAKKAVIEEDEYESGYRRILNYGHSFGHAIEALTENSVPHGYGVLFGMDLINFLGVKWGATPSTLQKEIQDLIKKYFSNFKIEMEFTPRALVNQVSKDKKMSLGKMNFAVLFGAGDIQIIEKDLDENLISLVKEYFDGKHAFTFS